jgi:DNA-nicking Smr family endonuclease
MDFERILEQWERDRKQAPRRSRAKDLEKWLETHPPVAKDEAPEDEASEDPATRRRRLRETEPQATLDLHGCTVQEAVARIESFLRACKKRGLEKVLIVHGKGNHSSGEPVLKRTVRHVLERSRLAGESGTPDRRLGGQGATWVVLR